MPVAGVSAPASSGTTPNVRALTITPSISVTETLTDNVRLTERNRRADAITQISPGITVSSGIGRIRGNLDYRLSGIFYARDGSSNNVQQSLSAAGNAEVIDNFAFVDASANISQQSRSAFGTRTVDPALDGGDQTEVRNYNLSPYVRGRLANLANYEARLGYSLTDTSTKNADVSTTSGSLSVVGDRGPGLFNWSADASRQAYKYEVGGRTVNDRARGTLFINATDQLRLSLIGGREAIDYPNQPRDAATTYGYGFDWRPNERTNLSGQREKRVFGDSHSLVFQYRTARTTWRFSDTKDVSTGFNQAPVGSGQPGATYEVLFQQFAAIEPDPVRRDILVRQYLLQLGVPAGFLTLQRRQELAVSYQAVRQTYTLTASQSKVQQLDRNAQVNPITDFSNPVRLRGLSANVSHRLTPQSNLDFRASIDQSRESGGQSRSTDLRALSLTWSGQLGGRTSYSLGARHVWYDGDNSGYRESAIYGTLTRSF
nr:TIGR03016 family PEP-CTERM system-associated outer membrane protein [Schlegelella koreensis]